MSEINRRDINRCTCHCGGEMFYRHLHAASCPVSVDGDEAPISENAALRAEVERLTRERDLFQTNAKAQHDSHEVTMHALANVRQQLAASQARIEELETMNGNLAVERADYLLKTVGLEQERDRLRTALENLKHADGCYCEASFSPIGCHPRHSAECQQAQQALRGAGEAGEAGEQTSCPPA